mmetsp:Transcript_38789/g.60385  ORF Transcript_38789/g.60385 Transcript_38789/m.60385 type:complete len:412 (+) Transcript_38789:51-1286(+)
MELPQLQSIGMTDTNAPHIDAALSAENVVRYSKLRRALEQLLSDTSLNNDKELRALVEASSDGWIEAASLLTHPTMKKIETRHGASIDETILCKQLALASSLLEVHGSKVRRVSKFIARREPEQRQVTAAKHALGTDVLDASQEGQITILVRHSKSKANEWQEQNHFREITPEIAMEFDLFNAALSEAGVRANRKHRGTLWRHIRHVAGSRKIRMFCSPIKRAIQTVMESLDCDEATFLFGNGPPKVSLMALLCETGSGSENDGIPLKKIMEDADLDKELHGVRFRDMLDLRHFRHGVWLDSDHWWNVEFRADVRRRAAELNDMLKWRRESSDWLERPTEGECIVCFTHWGFAKEVSRKNMANFGQDSSEDSQHLDRHAILEKLAPDACWSWWRRYGQYDKVLHHADQACL